MGNHDDFRQLISAYFDNELKSEEKQKVEDHILDCDSCKSYFQEMHKLSSTLHRWQDESLSPDLEGNINKKLREGKIMKKRTLVRLSIAGSLVASIMVLVLTTQLYVRRGIQARVRDASKYMLEETETLGQSKKYEPYYLESAYSTDEISNKTRRSAAGYQTFALALQAPSAAYNRGYADKSRVAIYPTPEVWEGETKGQFNTEQYDRIYENAFLEVNDNPLSTFSIDVDTASYSNLRRFITSGQRPPKDAVRIEEMVNYFVYDYPQPTGEDPFSVNIEAAQCPWNPKHDLVMIGLQGKELNNQNTPPSNLVFLIDVSGSMHQANKLPLLKTAFRMMVNQLRPEERVSIVTYAGAAGLVLDSAYGNEKSKILQAIDRLQAGGSTAGGQGIQLAYNVAKRNFIPNGNNRVILATDGDFNIGVSSDGELTRIIENKRKDGIFLSVLGFGTGNYKDSKMEKIADKGNGNYYYIDNEREAKKVLVQELGSMLFAIAKDVKLQIEFNPNQIKAYRLIGYENRVMAKEDFNDDTKDAGELGAGHTVTAFYEIVPASSNESFNNVDPLKYQKAKPINSKELLTVKLRYKDPDGSVSKLLTRPLSTQAIKKRSTSNNFKFASAVAEFGLILRESKHRGNANYQHVLNSARAAMGQDRWGYRAEFIGLVETASRIWQPTEPIDETPDSGYRYK